MTLAGKRVAVLVEQQYQEMEVWYPVYRLREAGCDVKLVGPEAGQELPQQARLPRRRATSRPRMRLPTGSTRWSSPAASRPTTSAAPSPC